MHGCVLFAVLWFGFAVAGRAFADLARMHASVSTRDATTSTPFLESFGDLFDE
jgi:hypothetical protein